MVVNPAFEHSTFVSFLCLVIFGVFMTNIPKKVAKTVEEQSICFILGEDKADQEFYSLASEYFSKDSVAQTSKLVRHIRSIEELILFLNNQKPDKPWKRIELVVHGNVWSGLSVKITDGGERAYPKELLRAFVENDLPTLSPYVIDTNTIVNVWGCGIGTNPIMNIALSKCFTDMVGQQAKVKASKKFVVFKRQEGSGHVKLIKASYWPYFFKRGYRPSDTVISRTMARQYPEANLNFANIISQKERQTCYEEQFHIPISWTVIYKSKESRPDVTHQASKHNWIRSQAALMKKIREMQIPFDQYHWTVNKIIHTNAKGQKVPAIKAIGMSTVLCVLEESV